MLRRSPLPPRTTRPRARNPRRQAKTFTRAYGSKERVLFVQALPCTVCRQVPSENAHIEGGGTGRKANASAIAPLCNRHHRKLHEVGRRAFEARYEVDLERAALRTAAAWLAHAMAIADLPF